ncbi:hypothetical protein [Actinomadura litoris]|uniref:hypothetical protein n=1 Tax=Actinomadura litoris TaxID=2678616 RepID=UPI001FA7B033|nr:hypothetical protein [Actinomadura litoris]
MNFRQFEYGNQRPSRPVHDSARNVALANLEAAYKVTERSQRRSLARLGESPVIGSHSAACVREGGKRESFSFQVVFAEFRRAAPGDPTLTRPSRLPF